MRNIMPESPILILLHGSVKRNRFEVKTMQQLKVLQRLWCV
ncbi:hypothetical protein USDA257_c50740 [Sinorhizobium fredii USDA 257]|uniref:Uncharacterized protein n=1 Tax=Sinorhizobium fredii (strain USDA 257) TaxID=1185652 RepID=I3XCJ4_SINF2|nr:hypothetical protein USDA257_c50740 [Sinorhizobium fredii USDA 257]